MIKKIINNIPKDISSIKKIINNELKDIKKVYKGNKLMFSNILPKEYQEVLYIGTSAANQYIDTLTTVEEGSKLEYLVKMRYDKNGIRRLCGGSGIFKGYFGVGAYNQFDGGSCLINYSSIDISQVNDIYMCLDAINLKVIANVNNSTISSYDHTLSQIITNNNCIFCLGGGGYGGAGQYCYGIKMIKNDEVVRDMIPCYRKADNVAGMYDLVSNDFFTNQGVGEFIVGKSI